MPIIVRLIVLNAIRKRINSFDKFGMPPVAEFQEAADQVACT
jgi:hypothetical protein